MTSERKDEPMTTPIKEIIAETKLFLHGASLFCRINTGNHGWRKKDLKPNITAILDYIEKLEKEFADFKEQHESCESPMVLEVLP